MPRKSSSKRKHSPSSDTPPELQSCSSPATDFSASGSSGSSSSRQSMSPSPRRSRSRQRRSRSPRRPSSRAPRQARQSRSSRPSSSSRSRSRKHTRSQSRNQSCTPASASFQDRHVRQNSMYPVGNNHQTQLNTGNYGPSSMTWVNAPQMHHAPPFGIGGMQMALNCQHALLQERERQLKEKTTTVARVQKDARHYITRSVYSRPRRSSTQQTQRLLL